MGITNWADAITKSVKKSVTSTLTNTLLAPLKRQQQRREQRRQLKRQGVVQTFGTKLTAHTLAGSSPAGQQTVAGLTPAGQQTVAGSSPAAQQAAATQAQTIQFAQWLHPNEQPKEFTHEKINAYKEIIRPGSCVVDIGAHTGDTSVLYALAAGPAGTVLALEPNPYVCRVLEENATLNKNIAGTIIPLNFAATEADGQFEFCYSDNAFCNGGNMSVIEDKKHKHNFKLQVQGRNLSQYIRQHHPQLINQISLIKTDTEGYDLFVLKSIEDLIRQVRPVIICEVLKKLTERERQELITFIRGLGYKTYLLNESLPGTAGTASPLQLQGTEVATDNVFVAPHYDVLCLPG